MKYNQDTPYPTFGNQPPRPDRYFSDPLEYDQRQSVGSARSDPNSNATNLRPPSATIQEEDEKSPGLFKTPDQLPIANLSITSPTEEETPTRQSLENKTNSVGSAEQSGLGAPSTTANRLSVGGLPYDVGPPTGTTSASASTVASATESVSPVVSGKALPARDSAASSVSGKEREPVEEFHDAAATVPGVEATPGDVNFPPEQPFGQGYEQGYNQYGEYDQGQYDPYNQTGQYSYEGQPQYYQDGQLPYDQYSQQYTDSQYGPQEGYYPEQQYDGQYPDQYGQYQEQPGMYDPNYGVAGAAAGQAVYAPQSEYNETDRAMRSMPKPEEAQEREPITRASVEEFRQRARNSNDPQVQLDYAKYLMEAAVTVQDDDPNPKTRKKIREAFLQESLKVVKRLATQGMGLGKPAYPEAQFFLATCYGNGSLGLAVDHDKAFNLYNQASKQNHPASTYRTAVCYEVGAGTKRDHARAVQFYRKAAAIGDTAAMYKLGMILLNGLLGQAKNPREAVTWLKRAAQNADEDNPHALHELGLAYEKATIPTIIPDEAYARELFTQAAQLNYPPSQFKLGCCYEYGTLTCPVDPRRSIAWYTRAAEKGDAESELALSGWYLTGSEGVLKQSDTEAYLWARKAADKGLAKAEYAVGYYSEVGIGVRQDIDEARRWYMRAAAQGNKRAMQRLTELKKLGSMRPKHGSRPTRSQAKDECVVM